MDRSIWFTSDNHFFHKNIIKYENRPFSTVHEMNQTMIDNWNKVVKPGDIVYHLGDFAMCSKNWQRRLFEQLNGEKFLIKGNHDGSATRMREVGFLEVYDRLILTIADQKVLLCHYPYLTGENLDFLKERGEKYKKKFIASRPDNEGLWLIHGHCHGKWKCKDRMINVAVENWNYSPIHVSTIEEIIRNGSK